MTVLDTSLATELIGAAADRIDDHADELSRLDAIAGDGDHGVNMASALADAVRRLDQGSFDSPSEVFHATGSAFLETVGGASGALLGAFFTAMAKSLAGGGTDDRADAAALGQAMADGTARLLRVGRTEPGQKTMVDALLPAIEAYAAAIDQGHDLGPAMGAAATAARDGAEATATMTPGAGRARFAAEQSAGHPDPGATTIAHVFTAWAQVLETEIAA